MADKEDNIRKDIMYTGKLLWEKDLASGYNGNISARLENELLMTAHGTSLGFLSTGDVIRVDLDGNPFDGGKVSTEKLLHTQIYKNFSEAQCVVHTHATYTNAYFLENEVLNSRIFEAKVYLGEVRGIAQNTPAVTDPQPVIAALKNNNIVVLRNHGVVAMGENLFDCFVLIQSLEETIKTDAISRLYASGHRGPGAQGRQTEGQTKTGKKFKLFSQEQIDEIVNVVNKDDQLGEMGARTNMTMDLAVKLDETGQTYSFSFDKGRIKKVGHDENVEFLINAPEKVWRAVFNREIDPFVATTQKKMHLKGDFAKISQWYAPCSRVFELWQKVPVE